ncbi:MAG: bifunctional enoyl-CoA hydratase/phosphate acetyltransferase [Rhodospirillales bacterium]
MSEVIENKTFDEIAVGDTACYTGVLTRDHVERWAALTGNLNINEMFENGSGQAMWAATLFSTIAGTQLPGLGSVTQAASVIFHRSLGTNNQVTATITVVEKRPATRTIILDCQAIDAYGALIVSGSAEVLVPPCKIRRSREEVPQIALVRAEHFDDLIERCAGLPAMPTAVCHPCSDYALKGTVEAAKRGLIEPILVGPKQKIIALADKEHIDLSPFELIDVPHSHAAAERSVALVRDKRAKALMKGSLHTDELLHEVMVKEGGLRTERRLSHCFLVSAPTYARRIIVTDAAICIQPTLEDKVDICQNAIVFAHVLGIERPKVALLAAVETVTPKMQATLDAAALCKMADRGQISGGILDGPLAFDNAVSIEAARTKGIVSPVAGVADILVAPDIESGNMLAKQLTYMAYAESAGLVIGARVPIVLTSRADSDYARLVSCALAVLFDQAIHRDPTLLKAAE